MGETKIEWAHYTFNAWRGCTKVSDGCRNCYAETLSKRNHKVLGIWGDNGTRPVAAESYWQLPYRWNQEAAAAREMWQRHRNENDTLDTPPERPRVFTLSLGDWLEDRPELDVPLSRLLNTIRDTPNLDWLLLTKRPENWRKRLGAAWYALLGIDADTNALPMVQMWLDGNPPPNVWVGTSVENQKAADERIPHLLKCPAAIRWLSVEPMLGPVELYNAHGRWHCNYCDTMYAEYVNGCPRCHFGEPGTATSVRLKRINWIVCGGESGPNARPFNIDWARDLRDQCKAAGVAFFMKQLGSQPVERVAYPNPADDFEVLALRDRKGGDMSEWAEDLRVREWPNVKI